MRDGPSVASPSLYRILGHPVAEVESGANPGTRHTASIETIDNDHAAAAFVAVDLGTSSDPGTGMTHAVETVDNDHAADLLTLASLGSSTE